MSTTIEWCNIPGYRPEVWNPVTGCARVSPGCDNCYAIRQSHRFSGVKGSKFEGVTKMVADTTINPTASGGAPIVDWSGKVVCHEDLLELPLRWREPRAIFVNSMSDLFHDAVPIEFIARVFNVAKHCPEHVFMILTKRPLRAKVTVGQIAAMVKAANTWPQFVAGVEPGKSFHWPLPNVWLGVSCENQAMADQRIPHLLKTPAAVRFVSVEPMLGPVDIAQYLINKWKGGVLGDEAKLMQAQLDWVICGGESGPGARPMHPDWPRALRDQCRAADVPFFFKQWGEYVPFDDWDRMNRPVRSSHPNYVTMDETQYAKLGKKAAGDLLGGVQYHEWPEVVK